MLGYSGCLRQWKNVFQHLTLDAETDILDILKLLTLKTQSVLIKMKKKDGYFLFCFTKFSEMYQHVYSMQKSWEFLSFIAAQLLALDVAECILGPDLGCSRW